jgi:hypothetical protein
VISFFAALFIQVQAAYRLCEMSMTEDGILVQAKWGRYVALRGDVGAATGRFAGVLVLKLKRAPGWLPRTVWTCTPSRELSREYATKIMRPT